MHSMSLNNIEEAQVVYAKNPRGPSCFGAAEETTGLWESTAEPQESLSSELNSSPECCLQGPSAQPAPSAAMRAKVREELEPLRFAYL